MFVFPRSNVASENSKDLWTLVMLGQRVNRLAIMGQRRSKGCIWGLMLMMKAMTSQKLLAGPAGRNHLEHWRRTPRSQREGRHALSDELTP